MKDCPKGRGNNSVISTSKIKKITPTRKNFMQKGNRAIPVGSKPHSKGLVFSFLNVLLYLNLNKSKNRRLREMVKRK